MSSMTAQLPAISEQLRRLINESGFSRYEISKQTGVDQATLSRFMKGSDLSTRSIDLLGKYLGLSLVQKQSRRKRRDRRACRRGLGSRRRGGTGRICRRQRGAGWCCRYLQSRRIRRGEKGGARTMGCSLNEFGGRRHRERFDLSQNRRSKCRLSVVLLTIRSRAMRHAC
jgi:transcriptional regulator with XRE-family HTH domain